MTTSRHEQLLNRIQGVLGGIPQIHHFESEQRDMTRGLWGKSLEFDIASFQNAPRAGMTTCVTLGLSDYELRDDKNKKPTHRIELLSALRNDTDFLKLTEDPADKECFYEDSLFYLACYIVNKNEYITVGDTWINFFSNQYQAFADHSELEHLFFMPPVLLSDTLKPAAFQGHSVNWLLCVPISEAELDYCGRKGPEALQELLIRKKIDISDLFRKSVV
jgi:antitoxin YqcF